MSAEEFAEWRAFVALQHEYHEAVHGPAKLWPHVAWHLVWDPPKE